MHIALKESSIVRNIWLGVRTIRRTHAVQHFIFLYDAAFVILHTCVRIFIMYLEAHVWICMQLINLKTLSQSLTTSAFVSGEDVQLFLVKNPPENNKKKNLIKFHIIEDAFKWLRLCSAGKYVLIKMSLWLKKKALYFCIWNLPHLHSISFICAIFQGNFHIFPIDKTQINTIT